VAEEEGGTASVEVTEAKSTDLAVEAEEEILTNKMEHPTRSISRKHLRRSLSTLHPRNEPPERERAKRPTLTTRRS
jgi:hypothetical protein